MKLKFLATEFGILGSILVLEKSGSEVVDDETLEFYCTNGERPIFMILNTQQEWSNAENSETEKHLDVLQNLNSSNLVDVSDSPVQEYFLLENEVLNDNEPSSPIPNSATSLQSTMTMTSTALTSTSSTNSAVLSLFSNFDVPWHRLPLDIIEKLNNKEKLEHRIHAFVQEVVKEMRRVSYYIPLKIFRNTAEKIVQLYPDTFEQKDKENKTVSSFSEILLSMMRNHNNYLNSASGANKTDKIPIKKRKTINSLKNSVVNWQPPDGDLLTCTEKKKFMLNIYVENKDMLREKELIVSYMKDCYAMQRAYFNNAESYPSVENIQENWPYIFNRECLFNHFIELTGIKPDKLFKSRFDNEKQTLENYLKIFSKTKSLFIDTADEQTILQAIATYFKEDFKKIFEKFPVSFVYKINQCYTFLTRAYINFLLDWYYPGKNIRKYSRFKCVGSSNRFVFLKKVFNLKINHFSLQQHHLIKNWHIFSLRTVWSVQLKT